MDAWDVHTWTHGMSTPSLTHMDAWDVHTAPYTPATTLNAVPPLKTTSEGPAADPAFLPFGVEAPSINKEAEGGTPVDGPTPEGEPEEEKGAWGNEIGARSPLPLPPDAEAS